MSIKGIEGLTTEDIKHELNNGAKFVMYRYCISLIVITFNRNSEVYFIKSDDNQIAKGILYSLISFIFGWWGFPWGPIHTIGSLVTNFKGGKDITSEVINASKSLSSH